MTLELLFQISGWLSILVLAGISGKLLLPHIPHFIVRASLSQVSPESKIPFTYHVYHLLPIVLKVYLLLEVIF